jgi:hyaluronan synthase
MFRSTTSTDEDLFLGFVARYGHRFGWVLVLGLTLGMAALSSAIRQSRHLAENPRDFFRLPAYLLLGTFFLTPIRLLGFVRMAHSSGWGTRKGGYAGERQRNPKAVLPFFIATVLIVSGTLLHG